MADPPPPTSTPTSAALFLTEAELARRWLHSPRSLQRWRRRGDGPPHLRLGRRIIYRLVDVEAFEAAARSGGGTAP